MGETMSDSIDLSTMGYWELVRLQDKIKEEVNGRRVYYLRTRASKGADYKILTWREDGVNKQKSLGRVRFRFEMEEEAKEIEPEKYHLKYRLTDYQKGMPYANRYLMTEEDYQDLYNIKPSEDNLQRPTNIIYNVNAYNSDVQKYNDLIHILNSTWSRSGVSTIKGVKLLDRLVSEGHRIDCKD